MTITILSSDQAQPGSSTTQASSRDKRQAFKSFLVRESRVVMESPTYLIYQISILYARDRIVRDSAYNWKYRVVEISLESLALTAPNVAQLSRVRADSPTDPDQ